MSKWADYLISGVRYDKNHEYIVVVEVRPDEDTKVGNPTQCERKEIVAHLKKRVTYITIYKDKEGKWSKGATVDIITVNGKEFIRTDKNQTPKDNLENLPEI